MEQKCQIAISYHRMLCLIIFHKKNVSLSVCERIARYE